MLWFVGFLYAAGLVPLWRAWQSCRQTSLAHALLWTMSAWLAWALVVLAAGLGLGELLPAGRYLAVCLTGCAGVAVLGARRPGVAAWNFVVLGLLAVLLLWLAEGFLGSGTVELGVVRGTFLIAALAVGILNYLPTRLGLAALLLAAAAAIEIMQLFHGNSADLPSLILSTALLALAPWAGWALCQRADQTASAFDILWRSFRDRYGFLWGQRLREQFNRSAANNGWPVTLGWSGLRKQGEAGPAEADLQATLQALMKRFGVAEE